MTPAVRTRVAVAAGRATGWLSRATGRGQGATISGRVMNTIAPDLLRDLAEGHRVTLVSATNGKTTTTRFLASALSAAGLPLVTNSTGANLTSGIAPTLARAAGSVDAVLEVDERVLPRVVDPLGARLLVFGNLSRDQLDRYGEVHAVGDAWREIASSHPDLEIVANASDPHVVWAATPAAVTWVELGLGWRQDAATCPSCGALLHWDERRFDCPPATGGCGFTQPDAAHRLDGDTLVLSETGGATSGGQQVERRVELALALPGRWNLANAALAVVSAVHLGVDAEVAAGAAAEVTTVAGRYMLVPLGDGRTARVFLAKNPAGWSEVLHHLAGTGSPVVIAVNARVADGKDPSWLWDVPYELLHDRPTAAAGERHLDVAVRLRYAGVEHSVEPDAISAARSLPGDDVHIVASYTQFSALYRSFGSDR